jgi:hypothetical protein
MPCKYPNQKKRHDLYAANQTRTRKMPCYVTRDLYLYAKHQTRVYVATVIAGESTKREEGVGGIVEVGNS